MTESCSVIVSLVLGLFFGSFFYHFVRDNQEQERLKRLSEEIKEIIRKRLEEERK